MRRKTNMPSPEAIHTYWAGHGLSEAPDICMACELEGAPLARAHIVAVFDGGNDEASNLLLLCKACHKVQEFISSVLVATDRREALEDVPALLRIVGNSAAVGFLYQLNGSFSPVTNPNRAIEYDPA